MASINSNTGEYLRVMLKDSSQINLFNKQFIAEVSRDKAMRDNKAKFDQPEYIKFGFKERWNLEITGTTKLDHIADEFYRCLALEDGFKAEDGWLSDES